MNKESYLQDLSEIKDLMNRSSRFFSLSGLSGILAGVYALLGAGVAYYLVRQSSRDYLILDGRVFNLILLDLLLVAIASIGTGVYLSARKAKKNGESLWNHTSRRLIVSFLIPFITGGIFILIKVFHNHYGLTGSLMLIFYGLALVNASKYTVGNVQYLGYIEIILGLICAMFPTYGFWFWVIGFGVMHIIYGSLLYIQGNK